MVNDAGVLILRELIGGHPVANRRRLSVLPNRRERRVPLQQRMLDHVRDALPPVSRIDASAEGNECANTVQVDVVVADAATATGGDGRVDNVSVARCQ